MNAAHILAAFAAITWLAAVGSSDAQAKSKGLATEAGQVNAASQALIDGKLDEAIAAYESLSQRMPSNHKLIYNRGLAHYRKGDLATARGLFAEAMNTTDIDLAAKASFNLGNCDYADAINMTEQDRPNVIELLRQAITHYRSALRLNSNDVNARANIELASQMIEKLQEQEKQEEEQQQQEQQQDQQQQSDSEQQQSEDQGPDDQQSKQDQESQQNENSAEEQDSEQSDSGQDQSEASDESSENQESDHDHSKPDAAESQQQASSGSESRDGEPEKPQESQNAADQVEQQESREPTSSGQVSPSNAEPEESDADDANARAAYGSSQPGIASGEIDQQEAMKMLQAIRDRDLMRRIQKLRETQRRHIPVERDW